MKRRLLLGAGAWLLASAGLGVPTPVIRAAEEGKAPAIQETVVTLKAQDGGNSWGILYTPANKTATTAFLSMHPRSDQSRQGFLKTLAQAGYAAFGHDNRYVLNDTEGIHEEMLLDIAAGVKYLKGRGYQKVVLLGNSGGGSLMAFYQAQAVTAPPGRVKSTPAGDPPDLNKMDLPAADGILFVIPHLGEGKILEARIDPSVVNEGDPLSIDPALDMYNPANGFRMPPEATKYSPEFIAKYRAAQHARMERLDQWARQLIAEGKHFDEMMKSPEFPKMPLEQRMWIERRARTSRMMTIFRTAAELRYMDLTIDPSDRLTGDNSRPESWVSNYESPSPNLVTPRAFLSSRSSISSNAVSVKNLPLVKVPVAIIQGTAHRQIYPSDTQALFKAIGSEDKELHLIEGGDVNFRPSGPKSGQGNQTELANTAIVEWAKKHFQ